MKRLSVSYIGRLGSDTRYHPSEVFRDDLAHSVCLALAEAPRLPGELARELGVPEERLAQTAGRLLDLGAIREEDGLFHLDFSLLTETDLRLVEGLTAPLAQALSDRVRAESAAIEDGLERLCRTGRTAWTGRLGRAGARAQLAFATVACYGLDWGGIGVLNRLGHLGMGREYPDGGHYVLIGEQGKAPETHKDYCASRTGFGGRWAFTSFGDESGPRYCLPDLLTRVLDSPGSGEGLPGDMVEAVRRAAPSGSQSAYDTMGAILAGEAPATGEEVGFLRRTGYLDGEQALRPVFRGEDVAATQTVIEAVGWAVAGWADEQVPRLGERLGPLTPVRHKVSHPDFLNHIWHFIFAGANRILAESGFVLDPEPAAGGQGRYLAWSGDLDFCGAVWRMCFPGAGD